MASDFAGGEVFARLSLRPRSRSRKVTPRPLDFGGEAPGVGPSPAPGSAPLEATESFDPPEPTDAPAEEHVSPQGPEFDTAAAETEGGGSSMSEDCPINLRDIVRRVGGDLYEGGKVALVPAPGQSRLTRGLVLRLAPDGRSIIWEALQKCSREDIEAYLQHACGVAARA